MEREANARAAVSCKYARRTFVGIVFCFHVKDGEILCTDRGTRDPLSLSPRARARTTNSSEATSDEELQHLDLNSYHPSVPVGLAVAKAASSLMAPAGAFSLPTDEKTAMDLLSKRLAIWRRKCSTW